MSGIKYTSLCSGSAECVAEMNSLAARIKLWEISGAVFLGMSLLMFLVILLRFFICARTKGTGGVDLESSVPQIDPDRPPARPFMLHKELPSLPTIVAEDESPGVSYGVPPEWFELADRHGEAAVITRSESFFSEVSLT